MTFLSFSLSCSGTPQVLLLTVDEENYENGYEDDEDPPSRMDACELGVTAVKEEIK
jgi:hypothetical protein